MEEKIINIVNEMAEYLSIEQLKKLQEVMLKNFSENEPKKENITNEQYLNLFLNAKQMEGCSERTVKYYRTTVEHFLSNITSSVRKFLLMKSEIIWCDIRR